MDRLRQRGLDLHDNAVFSGGALLNVNAVIHSGDDKSKPLWDRMELQTNEWAVRHKAKLVQMFSETAELFDFDKIKPAFVTPDGKPFEIKIELTDDNPTVQRAWRLAPKQLDVLDSHINQLLEAGVIYPMNDSNYSAVCVLVKKPGRPNELRVTTDFRKLNAKCLKHAFMSPTAKELFTMTACIMKNLKRQITNVS
jgi:hypothetical protein